MEIKYQVLKELIGIQSFPKEGVFNKEEGVEINGVPTLFLSDILSCLEIQVTGELLYLMLLRTTSMSLTVAAKLHSLIRFTLVLLTPLPWHRYSLAGVCSREKRLDMPEYQMLPAVGLSADVGNITSGFPLNWKTSKQHLRRTTGARARGDVNNVRRGISRWQL